MTAIWVFVVSTKLLPEWGRQHFFKSLLGMRFCSKFSYQSKFLQLHFSSPQSQMNGSRMWPQMIKNIFLIVTCNITIIGTKEPAVAQYLCCNPNWHSPECFGSKTRRRTRALCRTLGRERAAPLGDLLRGESPLRPPASPRAGGTFPGVGGRGGEVSAGSPGYQERALATERESWLPGESPGSWHV